MKIILHFLLIACLAVTAFAGVKNNETSELAIMSASYGAEGARIEVGDLLRPLIAHGVFVLRAPWGLGDPDPKPGTVKDVIIVYRHNGTKGTATFTQRQDIILPPAPKGLIIVSAMYGISSRRVDVTHAVRTAVIDDTLSLPPKWGFGRVDPAAGRIKTVEITYIRDGIARTATFSQSQKLELP